jgi:RNA polymerase sigma factor (TIGR02999 family)
MSSQSITELVRLWGEGDRQAGDRLFPLVYDELRRMARQYFRGESPGNTLQPTALVHDLYLKLSSQGMQFQDRNHFYAVAARQMRRLLIDHARAAKAEKRGGALARVELLQDPAASPGAGFEAVALDEALEVLESLDARVARVVELRYFAGLTEAQAADALGISVATLKRDWGFAQAWLRARLRS